MLTFEKISNEDLNMISLIVDRARSVSRGTNSTIDKAQRSDLIMALAAHHLHDPLRLDDLYKAPDFDLLHDIHGFLVNLNRETEWVGYKFQPRYAVRPSEEQESEKLGLYLINSLDLPAIKQGHHKGKTYTSWGAKTPIELGLLIQSIVEEKLYLGDSK